MLISWENPVVSSVGADVFNCPGSLSRLCAHSSTIQGMKLACSHSSARLRNFGVGIPRQARPDAYNLAVSAQIFERNRRGIKLIQAESGLEFHTDSDF